MKRITAVVLFAVVVAAPAAVAGPDALSIAKRALRLAKEPPRIERVYASRGEPNNGFLALRATCPRGMTAVAVTPDPSPGTFVRSGFIRQRIGFALFRVPDVLPYHAEPSITVTCIG